jgi:hypothetical protein
MSSGGGRSFCKRCRRCRPVDFVGVLSLLVTLTTFIWPYSEWAADDKILSAKWNELANKWHTLYEEQPDIDEKGLRQRIAELQNERVNIESQEDVSRYDGKVMELAEEQEREYQGMPSSVSTAARNKTALWWPATGLTTWVAAVALEKRKYRWQAITSLLAGALLFSMPSFIAVF